MNREECAKCLTVLKVTYQTFAKNMKPSDAENLIEAWAMCFRDEPYAVVSAAIYDLIQTKKDFAPDIATVKERIREMRAEVTGEPSNDELWLMLKKAASNSIYGAREEFEKLPPLLKKYLGSPAELHAMAVTPESTLDTVNRGLFYKNIDKTREREEFRERLNPQMRELLGGMAEKMRLDSEPRMLLPEEINDRRNRLLDQLEA